MKKLFMMAPLGLALGASHAGAFSLELEAGDLPRVDPMVRAHALPDTPATAAGAWFRVAGMPEKRVRAERDPGRPVDFLLRYPGALAKGTRMVLEFDGWIERETSDPGAADAAFVAQGPSGKPAWTYVAATDPAPDGVAAQFARSGFIHPFCAPDGDALSGTRPKDHFHHMGVWHAWTKTRFRGKTVDFWNIGDKHGTVRFTGYQWRHRGAVWQGLAASQEHVAWPGQPQETKVLEETLTLRSWTADGLVVLDYDIAQENVSTDPLELEAFRYGGGVAFRGRHDWGGANSDYLTSEGKKRADAHSTRARWIAAHGATPGGPKGVAMLGHPENVDAPQRVRTWPGDHGGAIFMNFVPTQEKPITLPPGGKIALRYRLVGFDGAPDVPRLEALWQDYAHPVVATVRP